MLWAMMMRLQTVQPLLQLSSIAAELQASFWWPYRTSFYKLGALSTVFAHAKTLGPLGGKSSVTPDLFSILVKPLSPLGRLSALADFRILFRLYDSVL